MQMVKMGQTGVDVSRLCFGCMTFGAPGWDIHPWVQDEESSRPILRKAVELGINFYDTADFYSYGESERITGKILLEHARREELVLATKVGLTMAGGPNSSGLSRKHIMQSIEASLKRLGTDYVDLYIVHRWDYQTPMEETLSALNDVVRSGKALYIGVSSMPSWLFMKAIAMQRQNGWAQFVSMQNFYNLCYREEEREMIPLCRSEGIALTPWSPLARGFLAGNRPKEGDVTKRGGLDKQNSQYFGLPQDYAILERVQKIADDRGAKAAQIALAWVLSKEFISTPIVGASSINQVEDAVAALDLKLDALTCEYLEEPYQTRPIQGHS